MGDRHCHIYGNVVRIVCTQRRAFFANNYPYPSLGFFHKLLGFWDGKSVQPY